MGTHHPHNQGINRCSLQFILNPPFPPPTVEKERLQLQQQQQQQRDEDWPARAPNTPCDSEANPNEAYFVKCPSAVSFVSSSSSTPNIDAPKWNNDVQTATKRRQALMHLLKRQAMMKANGGRLCSLSDAHALPASFASGMNGLSSSSSTSSSSSGVLGDGSNMVKSQPWFAKRGKQRITFHHLNVGQNGQMTYSADCSHLYNKK